MIKIGITGQSGFIGTHLYNTLGLYPERFERVPFEDQYFQDNTILNRFVSQCDVIVHLAAMNRHSDPKVIYETNIRLVKQLIAPANQPNPVPISCFLPLPRKNGTTLMGGQKKKGGNCSKGGQLIIDALFSGLIIPNVYGPFGHPYYNSVVATFSHQLTHNETPKIEIDGDLKLIYVGELANQIIDWIESVSKEYKNEAFISSSCRHTLLNCQYHSY